jgi:hypothetical protein
VVNTVYVPVVFLELSEAVGLGLTYIKKKAVCVCGESPKVGANRLSAIIEIIGDIVHDSRVLNLYTVVCTSKFL